MTVLRKILGVVLLTMAAISTQAAKVWPFPAVITQSDGTQLTVYGHGDEHLAWYTTTDGVLLVQRGTDFFVASVNNEGYLSATTQLAHEKAFRSTAEASLVAAQDKEAFATAMPAIKNKMMKAIGQSSYGVNNFPHSGSPKALVILVQFQDTVFKCANPKATFDNYLNGTAISDNDIRQSRLRGSVKQYFSDMSDGKFTPVFDIVGPVTVSQKLSYYGADLVIGSTTFYNDTHCSEMIKEACALVDDKVDFSQYDSDGDGYVDLVYIIYAGYSQSITGNSADCIWPKAGVLGTTISTNDGVKVKRYGVNNELNYYPGRKNNGVYTPTSINGIGLFCHEFSHTLGLPDLYPTLSSAQVDDQAMEIWSVMDGGTYTDNGYTPTPYTPWEKEQMGWTTLKTLTEAGDYTFTTDDAAKVMGDNGEYIILHDIQNSGWAAQLPGHGLLVYRIDYPNTTVSASDNPNNTKGKPAVTIVPADGKLYTSYSISSKAITSTEYTTSFYSDPYPGTSNVTKINGIKLNNSTMNVSISNIQEIGDEIYFTFTPPTTTAIKGITTTTDPEAKAVYTIDGRYVGESLEGLPKGVYIRGQKKVIVR